MRDARYLVAAVMRALQEKSPEDSVVDKIDRHPGSNTGKGWLLPDGMNARNFSDHLIYRGALQNGPDGKMACPIPSFRKFLEVQ